MSKGTEQTSSEVQEIVERHPPGRQSLIPILQDVQQKLAYLSAESVTELSRQTGISENEIYGVATFYNAFSLQPRGRYVIKVCMGTACYARGAPALVQALERALGISEGETTDDRLFTLETVHCLGACALGPLVVVGGDYHGRMTSPKTASLLKRYQRQAAAD